MGNAAKSDSRTRFRPKMGGTNGHAGAIEDPIRGPSEAEIAAARALLGCVLLDGKGAIDDLLSTPLEAIPSGQLRTVAEAILSVHARGAIPDQASVCADLLEAGLLKEVGGPSFVCELVDQKAVSVNSSYFASELRRLAKPRLVSAQLEQAARSVMAPKVDVADIVRSLVEGLEDEVSPEDRRPLTPLAPPDDWNDIALPPRRFALGRAFPLGRVTLVQGQGGGGKSMATLEALASVCVGRTLLPCWTAEAPKRALYLALEDDQEEILRRLQRIAFVFRLDEWERNLIARNLRFLTPRGLDMFRRGAGNSIQPGPDFVRLERTLKTEGPFSIIAIDPKSALLGGVLDENDNPTAQKVVNMLEEIAGPDAAIVLCDHVAKTDRDTAASARGGGAWGDAARQVWGMRPLTELEKRQAGPGFDPSMLMALQQGKSNYTGPRPIQYLARRANPEGAGVLEGVDFEGARQATAAREEDRLKEAILTVLSEHRCSEGELAGTSGTQERRAYGSNVRDLIADAAGQKVTARGLASTISLMVGAKELAKTKEPETGRVVVVPRRKEGVEDRNDKGMT